MQALSILSNTAIENTQIKIGWGCGFGPKDLFDYGTGTSVIPLDQLQEVDRRLIRTSRRGGGEIVGGTVLEEPDVGYSYKSSSTLGTPGLGRGEGIGGNPRGGFGFSRGGWFPAGIPRSSISSTDPSLDRYGTDNNKKRPWHTVQNGTGHEPEEKRRLES